MVRGEIEQTLGEEAAKLYRASPVVTTGEIELGRDFDKGEEADRRGELPPTLQLMSPLLGIIAGVITGNFSLAVASTMAEVVALGVADYDRRVRQKEDIYREKPAA